MYNVISTLLLCADFVCQLFELAIYTAYQTSIIYDLLQTKMLMLQNTKPSYRKLFEASHPM